MSPGELEPIVIFCQLCTHKRYMLFKGYPFTFGGCGLGIHLRIHHRIWGSPRAFVLLKEEKKVFSSFPLKTFTRHCHRMSAKKKKGFMSVKFGPDDTFTMPNPMKVIKIHKRQTPILKLYSKSLHSVIEFMIVMYTDPKLSVGCTKGV